MSEQIRKLVDEKLAELQVGYTAQWIGKNTDDGGWEHDLWRVSLVRKGKVFSTEYRTGLGHRKFPNEKRARLERELRGLNTRSLAYEQIVSQKQPVKPHPADVLHALCLDAEGASQSFSDWCSDFGYSNDSIKAFNTYRACEEIAHKLRELFTYDELREIREIVADL